MKIRSWHPNPVRIGAGAGAGVRPVDPTLAAMNIARMLVGATLSLLGSAAAPAQSVADVRLDGVVDEWPASAHAAADGAFLYFRLAFDEMRSLLVDDKPVRIHVDLDASSATGRACGDLGCELEIELRRAASWRDPYFFATVFDAAGAGTDLAFERLEPLHQPTSAADAFELRIRRDAHPALMHAGPARGRTVLVNARRVGSGRDSRLEDAAVAFEMHLPPGEPVGAVAATLPERRPGSIRLVSHNVLWSNPDENPAPFARMYQALDPDIYLIQEWGRGPWSPAYERELEAWFRAHVDPEREWTAVRSVGWGVAVVTHHPVIGRGPTELSAETLTRWSFPIRFAGAVVLTPQAPFAVGSIHLKAGGALHTQEDQRRFDEVRVIRAVMEQLERDAARAPGGVSPVTVLGGDYNHTGHPKVPAAGIRGLDVDDSPLAFAFTPVLGTDARYSFGGPAYGHRRSFLDYIAYPDARATVTNAFVLDTEILDDASLARMKLRRQDSSAADHLPVVVDLDPIE